MNEGDIILISSAIGSTGTVSGAMSAGNMGNMPSGMTSGSMPSDMPSGSMPSFEGGMPSGAPGNS